MSQLQELESSKVLKLPLALKDFCQSAISANVVPPTVVYMDEQKVCFIAMLGQSLN